MKPIGNHNSPIHPLAISAFLTAVVAIVLALFGSVAAEKRIANSPLNQARGESSQEMTAEGKTVGIVAFVVPFILGLAATFAGGHGMRRIERAQGRYRGDALGFFAILIGGLAAVIGACMMLALYLWPLIPAYGTT